MIRKFSNIVGHGPSNLFNQLGRNVRNRITRRVLSGNPLLDSTQPSSLGNRRSLKVPVLISMNLSKPADLIFNFAC